MPVTIASAVVEEIAPTGTLRVAVNTSNIVLVQVAEDGTLSGIVPALARELAGRLQVPLELIAYKRPGDVFAATTSNAWDVCFLAIEPERATDIAFTEPYVLIDGTYLVRDPSPFRSASEMDRPGMRIGVGTGSAYELFLTRTLQSASLIRTAAASTSGEMLQRGEIDAIAGVRQALDRMAQKLGGMRVLPDRFMAIGQAAGMPHGRPKAHAALEAFIRDMKSSGFVADALEASGQDRRAAAP
jgi:polar amino acid transport system substrate-binding protein